jgi:hypothetical protein
MAPAWAAVEPTGPVLFGRSAFAVPIVSCLANFHRIIEQGMITQILQILQILRLTIDGEHGKDQVVQSESVLYSVV